MAIGLNDLDPSVATTFAECLHTVSFKQVQEHKPLLAALRKQRWLGAGWTSFVPAGAAFASIMAATRLESQPWLVGGLFGLSFLCSGVSLWHTSRRDLRIGFRTNLPSDVLLAALPLMPLSPAEALYAKTVALLAALQVEIEEQTTRSILLRLNEMLANYRDLETQCQRLTEALAQHSVTSLETEQATFIQRLQETADPVTRQSLQQSLQMCTSRLEDTQTMAQNLQRVVAQQEAIQQTFASVHSSLVRMQTTPSSASPAVVEIVQAVTQINQKTQATEEAVQEVASL